MSLRADKLREAYELLRRDRAEKRKARPKPKPVAKGQREPRQRDPGFLAYLRRQPCEARHLGGCEGAIQSAHIRMSVPGRPNPGMQRKADDKDANPLCEGHHLYDQHKGSERAFWDRVGKDPFQVAAAHYAAYLAEGARATMDSGFQSWDEQKTPSRPTERGSR